MDTRRLKNGAQKRIALMTSNKGDGPMCNVQFCKAIEILGAEPSDIVSIEVFDDTRSEPVSSYTHKGSGWKALNVPRGMMRVRRVKGTEPLTIYAHCGP